MQRIILHIDMNSYFASVEQQANPHLQGKAVGVCEHLGGVIIAPSVEAKRQGIKLGTPVWEAVKIDPGIVLLHTDPEKYREVTRDFLKILRDYTNKVEQYSIDEAFMDLTDYCGGDWGEALMLAFEIKQRLRFEVGEWVSASIGIGANKLVAKIAADLDNGVITGSFRADKALLDRICLVKPNQIEHLYELLELTDVPGIGKRLEKALNKLGIYSLRELAEYSSNNLINHFGINGYLLHLMANFHDDSEIIKEPELNKSIGHAYTLPKSTKKIKEIKGLLMKLSEKVGRRMRKAGARGDVISFFYSDKQGRGFHKRKKIGERINIGKDIYKYAWNILKKELKGRGYELRVKIVGVSISGLRYDQPQAFLFEEFQRPVWLVDALDKINDKYGEYTTGPGTLLRADDDWAKDSVGFSRIK